MQNFVKSALNIFFKTAVIRAMKKIKIQKDTPIMVAVSGGKDSLVLWDVLNELGYKTMGIHIDLGIDEFSKKSIKAIENFAGPRDLEWKIYHLTDFVGLDMVQIHKKNQEKDMLCLW